MNKQNFIGKVVISAKTQNRFILTKIHAAYICVGSEKLNQYGTRSSYMFKVDNEDPFTTGALYFEDAAVTELLTVWRILYLCLLLRTWMLRFSILW